MSHDFVESRIRGAIEPICSAEVSIVHIFAEARRYIESVDLPVIQSINGDVYYMLA